MRPAPQKPASSLQPVLWLGATLVSLLLAPAQGQVVVSMKPVKKLFVAYDPIQVEMSILNRAGRDIVLSGKGSTPWLSFQITDESGHLVSPEGSADFPPVMVPAGQALSRTVALNHLYPMTRQGLYRVQASVYFPQLDNYFNSQTEAIQVAEAQELWSQVVGVPEGNEKAGTYRRYILLTFNNGSQKLLYIRVQDEKTGTVRTSFSLGQVVMVRPPEWIIDVQNTLHVLHMGAPRTFAYTVVDIDGKMLKREVYHEEGSSRPKLSSANDGAVVVVGGVSDQKIRQDPLHAEVRKISERPEGLPLIPAPAP